MGISRSQKPHILSKHPLVLKGRSDVDFKWWFQGFDTPTYIYIYAYIDLIYMYIYIFTYPCQCIQACIFLDISEQWEHNPPNQYLDVQLEDSFLDLFQPDFRRHLRYHRNNDSQRYVEAPTRKNSQTPSTSNII